MANGDDGERFRWREVVSTMIGVLPFALALAIAVLKWGTGLELSIAVQQQRISTLEFDRQVIEQELAKISDKLDGLNNEVLRNERPNTNGG